MDHCKTGPFSPLYQVLSFICVLTFVPSLSLAQADTYEFSPDYNCLTRGGNYTADSTFATNLNRLISSLSSLAPSSYGFYNISIGDPSEERANAIALCRREVRRDDCLSCVQTAAKDLTEQCPRRKEAVVWYTHCMFRYSNRSILGRTETSPTFSLISSEDIAGNRTVFESLRGQLLNRLKGMAATGGPRRQYAQGNGSAAPGYQSFYGSAQCTPDLSEQDCNDCLEFGFGSIPSCCDGSMGLRWFCPSCNFRFETWRFYELQADLEPDTPAPSPSPAPSNDTRVKPTPSNQTRACLCIFLKRKKRKSVLGKSRWSGTDANDELSKTESLLLEFGVLKAATNNFSSENELGRGGFGTVYKGVLHDGQEVAVKRLSEISGQGDNEFKNEVLLVAKLQHRNLVRLLGFCLEGQERILVYEFIKNSSLDHFIFDPEKRRLLDWGVRYKVIEGIARGLLYLHEDSRFRIIHRDLKASNILLGDDMNPKIADFGLAKLFETNNQQATHKFTNRIAGTYGYMAPEYAMRGQFSVKTDVFSFGVLVLEIITGKRNNDSQGEEYAEDLLTYVWRNWREDTVLSIIDPSLTTGSRNEILRSIHIGLLCVQENAVNRPTMATVAMMLSSFSLTLPMPSRPAFVLENSVGSNNFLSTSESTASRSEVLTVSVNDASFTELSPR
ncbi:PREDICTED: cysteine-rich receptor-like protein kinase 29 isoform X2 [Tarenaya hassleriana]|uniref:cysteine-rich receptor-like protein kinase 29 isoform X2 n=1 Tax=Tarenaya hassleriana TaxID=28532 RepID=UPI00053C29FE|nr:PREDICTED: cysteine-rich receptor-like protein kinase 29 isoform X2 [Tarenaya hassleriana]